MVPESVASGVFTVDSILILRGFCGVLFGAGYALALSHSRLGRYLADELTWMAVVLGMIGVMAISWPGNWYTVAVVLAASSLGIITRSLVLDSRNRRDDTLFRSHKTKAGIDEATFLLVRGWGIALDAAQAAPAEWATIFNQLLQVLELARCHLVAARRGDEFELGVKAKKVMR